MSVSFSVCLAQMGCLSLGLISSWPHFLLGDVIGGGEEENPLISFLNHISWLQGPPKFNFFFLLWWASLLGLSQKQHSSFGHFGFCLFSMCSHQVPNVFPEMFPIVPHVLSHMVWPWFNFHVYKVVKRRVREGSINRLLCWGVRNAPKLLVMGQSNGSSWK